MIFKPFLSTSCAVRVLWKRNANSSESVMFLFSRKFSNRVRSEPRSKSAASNSNDNVKGNSSNVSLSEPSRSSLPTVSVGKVKQAGKDVFWTGIVIAGVGVTGLMGYVILRELFSSSSPNGVYSEAFKRCKKDHRVQSILGSPVKAYGQLSSIRGRRRHVQSVQFLDGQSKIIQLVFYISGPFNAATVYAEKDVTNGTYRVLRCETDDGRDSFSILEDPLKSRSSTIFG